MNNIQAERKKLDLSQAQLADSLSWNRSRLANYEAGLRAPGLSECREIVEALNRFGGKCTLDSVFPPA